MFQYVSQRIPKETVKLSYLGPLGAAAELANVIVRDSNAPTFVRNGQRVSVFRAVMIDKDDEDKWSLLLHTYKREQMQIGYNYSLKINYPTGVKGTYMGYSLSVTYVDKPLADIHTAETGALV